MIYYLQAWKLGKNNTEPEELWRQEFSVVGGACEWLMAAGRGQGATPELLALPHPSLPGHLPKDARLLSTMDGFPRRTLRRENVTYLGP